jgi:hypothetical protein
MNNQYSIFKFRTLKGSDIGSPRQRRGYRRPNTPVLMIEMLPQ